MDTMDSLLDDEEMVCGLLIYRFGGFQRFLGWFSLHWVDPLNGFFSMQTGRWTWVNLRGWKLSTLTPPFNHPFLDFSCICVSPKFSRVRCIMSFVKCGFGPPFHPSTAGTSKKVMHAYKGPAWLAAEAAQLGRLYFSFPPSLVYKWEYQAPFWED